MSKERNYIIFQSKKKQTIICEDDIEPSLSIEVENVVELVIFDETTNTKQPRETIDEGRCGSDTFTAKDFNKWKKVNNEKDCAFLCHVGNGNSSNVAHNFATKYFYNLKHQPCHLKKIVEKQSDEEIKQNRVRLKTSIDAIKWLTLQACAFRGHDERCNSKYQENFLEMLKILDSYNTEVKEIVLDKALKNAKYTSPQIQTKFYMFLPGKCKDIRCQGYDDASNMRGEWNGLQALFLKDCRYAYYIHCLAHQLQLALVATTRKIPQIHTLCQHLVLIINGVTSSTKRHDELQANQIAKIEYLKKIEEIQTGKSLNQIETLQHPGDTRWSSHFTAICSLIRMYGATRSRSVQTNIGAQGKLLLNEVIMAITDLICRALQQMSQDIVNAMHLVSITKVLIQKLRNDDWESLLENVKSICDLYTIMILDMDAPYFDVLKSLRRQGKQKQMVTMEHHYRVEIFFAVIDQQLQELNNRFNEQITEFLILSASLNPRNCYKSFNVENLCKLGEKFYLEDFLEDVKFLLKCELQYYGLYVPIHPDLKNLSTLGDLCRGLVIIGKTEIYSLMDRLLRLVLTLPASTAIFERAFSAMKIVNTSLRSRMEYEFLKNYLLVYIKKEIAESVCSDEMIDTFYLLKERRAHIK